MISFQHQSMRVPLRIWAQNCPKDVLALGESLASQSFVTDAVCLMADAHLSKNLAIGSVFASDNYLIPQALGSDIGCGITAYRLSVSDELDFPILEAFLQRLSSQIPITERRSHQFLPATRFLLLIASPRKAWLAIAIACLLVNSERSEAAITFWNWTYPPMLRFGCSSIPVLEVSVE